MNRFSRWLVTAVAAGVLIAGCSADTPGAGPVPTPSDSPATSEPTAPESPPTESSQPEQTSWPTPGPSVSSVQGNVGGTLTIGGRDVGRGTEGDLDFLVKSLGEPEETRAATQCGKMKLPHKEYRWGAFTVTILDVEPDYEYGFSFPAGSVAGWEIDPTKNEPWPGLTLKGPMGVQVGTTLKSLESTFSSDEWGYPSVETMGGKPTFEIFIGDTGNASFTLDSSNRVTAMSGGWTCGT